MKFWMIPGGGDLQVGIRCGLLDGEPVVSVLDVYREAFQLSKGAAKKLWQRTQKMFPLDTGQIRSMKFPGRRQRETSVANRVELIKVLGLPPRQPAAAEHRNKVANLAEMALSGKLVFAEAMEEAPKQATGKSRLLLRSPERARSVSVVKQLQGLLHKMVGKPDPNVYSEVFRDNMVAIKGMEPHTMRKLYGLSKSALVRDCLDDHENVLMAFLELLQVRALEGALKENRTGKFVAVALCGRVRSEFVRSQLSKVQIPVVPVRTHEIYIGMRIRTEGSDVVEEVSKQQTVIAKTQNPEEAYRTLEILKDAYEAEAAG